MHFATALCGACALASAQEIVVTGHVKRVVLEPRGADDCPEPCPPQPPGSNHVCISNTGGCQTMDVEVDHVYRDLRGHDRACRRRALTPSGTSAVPDLAY